MYLNIFSFIFTPKLQNQRPKHLFVALFETWLTNTHKETELEIDCVRNCIKSKHGWSSGGVAIYVCDDIYLISSGLYFNFQMELMNL